VADELGSAELRIVVNDREAKGRLQALRREIEGLDRSGGTRTRAGARPVDTSLRTSLAATQRAEERLAATRQRSAATAERAAIAEEKRRTRDIRSNALIGGAFPLLFGQGIGASLGGALGGGIGGAIGGQFGFGLSLVGTAVGAQFDKILNSALTLAKGLDAPIESFNELQQANLISTKAQEKYIETLIKSGRTAEASALIQLDLLDTLGSGQAVDEYKTALDELNRAWAQAGAAVAGFIAGPLAALTRQLAGPGTAIGTAFRFEQVAGQLTPQQYNQVRQQVERVTEQRRLARGGFSQFLPPSEADVQAGREAGVELAQKLLGVDKQRAAINADLASAQLLTNKQRSTEFSLITASVQGYKRRELQLEKEQVLINRNRKLLELPVKRREGTPEALLIQQEAAKELFAIQERINDLDQDRLATLQEQSAQFRIQSTAIQRQITNAIALAKVQTPQGISIERQELERRLQIQESIAAARDKERRIGAQIDAARIRGGDAGEQEASRLVREQLNAAKETELALRRGADALTAAGQRLTLDLNNAAVRFTEIRSDPQGLNRFLDPGAIQNRAQADFSLLLPQFREAQGRFRALTGANAPEFTGPTAGVNAAIRDFINAVNQEFGAGETLQQIQRALADNTSELAAVNRDLASATISLANKDWTVLVNGSPYALPAAQQNLNNAAIS